MFYYRTDCCSGTRLNELIVGLDPQGSPMPRKILLIQG